MNHLSLALRPLASKKSINFSLTSIFRCFPCTMQDNSNRVTRTRSKKRKWSPVRRSCRWYFTTNSSSTRKEKWSRNLWGPPSRCSRNPRRSLHRQCWMSFPKESFELHFFDKIEIFLLWELKLAFFARQVQFPRMSVWLSAASLQRRVEPEPYQGEVMGVLKTECVDGNWVSKINPW